MSDEVSETSSPHHETVCDKAPYSAAHSRAADAETRAQVSFRRQPVTWLEARYPGVPWRQLVDTRTLLAHGYRHVEPAIVCQVMVGDLPKLKAQIRGILDDFSDAE